MEKFPEEVTTQFGGDFLVLLMRCFSFNNFFYDKVSFTWRASISRLYHRHLFSIVFVYNKIFFPYL